MYRVAASLFAGDLGFGSHRRDCWDRQTKWHLISLNGTSTTVMQVLIRCSFDAHTVCPVSLTWMEVRMAETSYTGVHLLFKISRQIEPSAYTVKYRPCSSDEEFSFKGELYDVDATRLCGREHDYCVYG